MQDCARYVEEMTRLRREIHRRPEEGWTEFETQWKVFRALEALGWTIRMGLDVIRPEAVMGRNAELVEKAMVRAAEHGVPESFLKAMGGYTGLTADFDTGCEGPVTGFRFDMDCVLVEELHDASHLPAAEGFDSEIPGHMHACGHDAHTATGVTLAHWITDHKDELKGRFRLIFQPAEEGTRGAAPMAAAGVVDDLNWFFGAHVGCNCRIGEASVVKKGFLATTKIDIEFTGVPSHAGSDPEKGRSALMAAAAAAVMMQGIPRHGEGDTRIAVGRLVAGEGRNVTPVHAFMQCETRGSTQEINEYMFESVRRIVEGCAASYGVECRVTKAGEATNFEATPAACDLAVEACAEVFGRDHVTPVLRLRAAARTARFLRAAPSSTAPRRPSSSTAATITAIIAPTSRSRTRRACPPHLPCFRASAAAPTASDPDIRSRELRLRAAPVRRREASRTSFVQEPAALPYWQSGRHSPESAAVQKIRGNSMCNGA